MELNGAPASPDQMRVLALTNYGHFTSMLVKDFAVRGLSLHLERLTRDCRQLFDTDLDTNAVRHQVRHALAGNPGPVMVRVTVYDPALDLGTIGSDAEPSVLVTTRPAGHGALAPLRLQAARYQRETPTVKHVSLFGALTHRRRAQRAGFDDVLFISDDGMISEASTSNIGFVRQGRVVWPRAAWLPGVTMALIDQRLDQPARTEPVNLSDLQDLEAAFVTSSGTGVRAVLSVDRTEWRTDHEVLDKVRELYTETPYELL
ncbi:aminotransferase class IV family protein [Frankia sp. AgPm24]|uniref:aminotransferase class IV family protein n=1 Tax=Frankia sp. AgPm24 TaxID=631128 RepID=UPI00200D6345|nr:aminotransferase class IV family protein [Frankia sp. AgPm24]MCK9921363.1 aminotransferase class IV family protein [Frankia sp. AgPm24]